MVFDCKDKNLIGGSVELFNANRGINEIFVSEDGQYFHSVSASNYHCKQHRLKLFRITRAQLPKPEEKPAPKAKADEPAKPELKAEAKTVPPPKKKAGRPAGKSNGNGDKNAKTEK
jgi:hypothetical protein